MISFGTPAPAHLTQPCTPALHVRPKPGGAERPPPVLLVKPDRTLDEVPDRRLDDREPVRAEMIAQEVEAPLDPPDEGLVRVVNFCSWLRLLKKSFEGLGRS